MQGAVAQLQGHLALHSVAQCQRRETAPLHLHIEIALALQQIALGQSLQQGTNVHSGDLLVHLVGGGLLACVENPFRAYLTARHGRAELFERQQSLGQSHLQIDGAEIQPFQAQAAKLQPTIQIHTFERAQIRFNRGEGFALSGYRFIATCRGVGGAGRRLGLFRLCGCGRSRSGEPFIEIQLLPLEIEVDCGNGTKLHGSITTQQRLIGTHHQLAQDNQLLVELGTGKTGQFQLHLRAWQRITFQRCRQQHIGELGQLHLFIEPSLERSFQRTSQ